MTVFEAQLEPKHLNLWKKGLLAIEQKNWEYAVSLILPVVKEVPTFLDGRKAIRRAEGELAGTGKKFSLGGGGMFGGKKDPWESIADLEERVFQKDPFSESGNKQLYELALKVQYPDLGAFALETIRMGQPTNTKLMHQLALHYITYEQPEKASEVYAAIVKIDPRDMLANKGAKDAAARSSIKNQGWGDKDFKSAVKNSEEQNVLELLAKKGKTKEQTEELLAHFAAKYSEEPTNINNVKAIAQLYEELEDLPNALSYYEYALTLNASDVSLQRRTEILRDKHQDAYIAQLEAWLAAYPDAPEAEEQRKNLITIKQQRASSSISEAKARAERNPTDKALRFDLGQAYFNAEMYTEAIPELQQAKGNPHIRIKAMLMLGRCFERKNMNDLSKSAFIEANKELTIMDNTKKEVLYELAHVCEKMGDKEGSLEALKEIYNADYGYKDVAKRVESSYS